MNIRYDVALILLSVFLPAHSTPASPPPFLPSSSEASYWGTIRYVSPGLSIYNEEDVDQVTSPEPGDVVFMDNIIRNEYAPGVTRTPYPEMTHWDAGLGAMYLQFHKSILQAPYSSIWRYHQANSTQISSSVSNRLSWNPHIQADVEVQEFRMQDHNPVSYVPGAYTFFMMYGGAVEVPTSPDYTQGLSDGFSGFDHILFSPHVRWDFGKDQSRLRGLLYLFFINDQQQIGHMIIDLHAQTHFGVYIGDK